MSKLYLIIFILFLCVKGVYGQSDQEYKIILDSAPSGKKLIVLATNNDIPLDSIMMVPSHTRIIDQFIESDSLFSLILHDVDSYFYFFAAKDMNNSWPRNSFMKGLGEDPSWADEVKKIKFYNLIDLKRIEVKEYDSDKIQVIHFDDERRMFIDGKEIVDPFTKYRQGN